MSDSGYSESEQPQRRARSSMMTFVALLLLVAVIGAGLGWMVWRGALDKVLPQMGNQGTEEQAVASTPSSLTSPADAASTTAAGTAEQVAELEARISRMNLQADATTSQALRAENLLIAMASRRAIERGRPLGYLEGQLRLRFAGSQQAAVNTLLSTQRDPITLDSLLVGLDGLASAENGTAANESGWKQLQRQFTGLFVIHRQRAVQLDWQDRKARARASLMAGRIDGAIAQLASLGGQETVKAWTDRARRYAEVQSALDAVEEAAMIGLPSSLAPPSPPPSLSPPATPTAEPKSQSSQAPVT